MKLIGANGLRYVQPDELPLAAVPTSYWAGTREKIEAMRERVERGEAVFHPCDAQRKKSSCGQMQRKKRGYANWHISIDDAAKQIG